MSNQTDNRYEFLPAGQPAPNFKLEAVKSGRRVSPTDCAGQPLGLVFHGRETIQAVVEINEAVRPTYPLASQVTLASVVDLSSVPRLLRRMATPVLEQAYDQAARQTLAYLPDGFGPEDYVFLLPDWDGKVSKTFGVRNTDKTAAVVVIDRSGIVIGSYQGPGPGPATLSLVQKAMQTSISGRT